jgi:hypothetical protein
MSQLKNRDTFRVGQLHTSASMHSTQKTPRFMTNNKERNSKSPYQSLSRDNNNQVSFDTWSVEMIHASLSASRSKMTRRDSTSTSYSSSSSAPCMNDLYQTSLLRKKQIYIDQYNRRQSTPHPSRYLSLYCSLAPSILKPKQIGAKEIQENDPFNKGPLLTYYCHPCNSRHYFHKGDIILSDGGHYYSSEESEEGSPQVKDEVTTVAGGSVLSSIDGSTSPILKFTLKDSICCADDMCACPRGLTATVLCYDCHDDFHQNLCGEVVYLYDHCKNMDVARHICHKCYNLCSVGRELCKHPGDMNGLIQCSECKKKFHADGCGWKEISIGPYAKRPFQAGYRCNICIGNKPGLSKRRRETLLGKKTKNKKKKSGIYDCLGKENNSGDVWV